MDCVGSRFVIHRWNTECPQASTRYFLRVVMILVVTSVTTVPKSSSSDPTCWEWAGDCPDSFPSYGGRRPEPNPSHDLSRPSTTAGTNFHTCQAFEFGLQNFTLDELVSSASCISKCIISHPCTIVSTASPQIPSSVRGSKVKSNMKYQ